MSHDRLDEVEPTLAELTRHLDEYAQQLSPRERRLLDVIVYRAMSPLERARARGESAFLTEEEQSILREVDEDLGTAR